MMFFYVYGHKSMLHINLFSISANNRNLYQFKLATKVKDVHTFFHLNEMLKFWFLSKSRFRADMLDRRSLSSYIKISIFPTKSYEELHARFSSPHSLIPKWILAGIFHYFSQVWTQNCTYLFTELNIVQRYPL